MKKTYIENTVISVLAVWAVSAIPYALKIAEVPLVLTNSVFSIFAVAGIWILLKGVLRILNKRLIACAGIAGFLFACMSVIGTEVYQGSFYGILVNVYAIVGLTTVFTAVSALIMHYYDVWMALLRFGYLENRVNDLVSFIRKKIHNVFLGVWGLIFLCWVPGLLSAFPGIYAYDSIFQMKWFAEGQISGHHPILHTYMLGGLLSAGKELFGSYEVGMFIYSLIQMGIMSYIFAYIVKYIGKVLPRIMQVTVLLFYALIPYNVLFSFSATKDVIFAGIFAVLVVKSYEMVRDADAFFSGWKRPLGYIGWTLLMCAFRNNGYYAFLCLIPVMLIVCRHYWKKAILIGLAVLVGWNVYTGPVYSVLGVTQGSTAEMLSVPMQQLSYVMCSDPSKLTEEEKMQIAAYIPDYQKYGASVSDYVKDSFNSELFDEAPVEFIKLWISVGIKYPFQYVSAFLRLNLGFWYPDMGYPDPGAWHPYIEYMNTDMKGDWILVERTSLIPPLSKMYEKFAYETIHQRIPLLSMLFQPGFTFWMICLGIMLCIYKKRYEMAVPFSIMIGLWLTLMLSPVVLLRYAYPLIVSMPIVMCMCCESVESIENK